MVAPGPAHFYPSGLMRSLVRLGVKTYQRTLSPLLSCLAGPAGGCRFDPTCSDYFLQAVEKHGVWRGGWLGLKRIGRCHPWGGQGHDPVPERIGQNGPIGPAVCE